MTDGVKSNIRLEDVDLKLAALQQPFQDLNGSIILDGDDLRSEGLRVRIGRSDLALYFSISNVSAMLHHSKAPVDLALHGESRSLNMTELLTLNGKPVDAPWARDTVYDLKFDLDLHTTVDAMDKARYIPAATVDFKHLEFRTAKYPHHLDDVRGTIAISGERLSIEDLTFKLGSNDVHADVELTNLGALLDSTRKERVEHRTALRSTYFNAKELLVYDDKTMIHDSIGEEVIHDLVFIGSGSLQSNTFTTKGFISETHIDRFTVRVNELPALRDVAGFIRTDTIAFTIGGGPNMLTCYGDGGLTIFMRQNNGAWGEIWRGQPGGAIILSTQHNNGNDIATGGPGFSFPVSQWNGATYIATGRTVSDSALGDARFVPN